MFGFEGLPGILQGLAGAIAGFLGLAMVITIGAAIAWVIINSSQGR